MQMHCAPPHSLPAGRLRPLNFGSPCFCCLEFRPRRKEKPQMHNFRSFCPVSRPLSNWLSGDRYLGQSPIFEPNRVGSRAAATFADRVKLKTDPPNLVSSEGVEENISLSNRASSWHTRQSAAAPAVGCHRELPNICPSSSPALSGNPTT